MAGQAKHARVSSGAKVIHECGQFYVYDQPTASRESQSILQLPVLALLRQVYEVSITGRLTVSSKGVS
jgi:hypothetical protein